MKTRIFTYFALCALVASVSCQKEPEFTGTPELEGGGVVLSFVCDDHTTKTTMEGEDAYNENTLTTIDYFLYPEGQTGSNAYVHGRATMNGRTSYNVLVNTSQLNALFAGAAAGNKCDVFAIANYPTTITGNTDIETLKNLALTTNFNGSTVMTNFVMCGQAKAVVINKNKTKAAEGTVTLTRAASKITFECKVADHVVITNTITSGETVEEREITWVPILDQMGVYLVNGYSKGKVNGEEVTLNEDGFFKYSQRTLTDDDNDDWYSCAPFYSYAQHWNDGDEREPFLKLVVPWAYLNQQGQQAGQKQFYYKVPCPGLNLEANTWYHIKLDVAILGGDDFEAMLTINGQYYVMEWNTQTIVQADAEIKDARYISVPSNAYNMYNTSRLDAIITSSHDAAMTLKSVYYYDYVNDRNTDYTTTAKNNNWITYDDDTRTFTINHTLNNNISSSSFDSSPYVFTFEIHHADDSNYSTGDIVVTQYPAMYIKAEESNGYVYVKGTTNVNGSDTMRGLTDDAGNPIGSLVNKSSVYGQSGDNNNTNQYTVYVTSLPTNSTYVIGDPRIGTTTAVTGLDGLTNYQPTADDTQNVISPVFKIASSYGKTSTLWYENAKTRCAAYQENGYPAGRWRLPTVAEIEFLVSLSENDKIPSLFSVDRSQWNSAYNISYYWAGGNYGYGPYEVMDFSGKNTTTSYNGYSYDFNYTHNNQTTRYHCVYTRCVYDVWYWGEEQDEDSKTNWGGYQTQTN